MKDKLSGNEELSKRAKELKNMIVNRNISQNGSQLKGHIPTNDVPEEDQINEL
jgi:hypothetical protein